VVLAQGCIAKAPDDEGAGSNSADLSKAELRVLQFNITHDHTSYNAAIKKITNWGWEKSPVIATLQEVCYDSMYLQTLNQLGGKWTFSFHPHKGWLAPKQQQLARTNDRCPVDNQMTGGKATMGNVVIVAGVKQKASKSFTVSFNPNLPQNWGMACAKFPWKGLPITACSTHLVANLQSSQDGPDPLDPKLRLKQAAYIKQWMKKQRQKGRYPIIAGDFNAAPHSDELSKLYHHGGSGMFCEADGKCDSRGGQKTADNHAAKIDYVFVAKNRYINSSLNVTPSATSDHHMLKAKFQLALGAQAADPENAKLDAEPDPDAEPELGVDPDADSPPEPPEPPSCNDNDCWRAILGSTASEAPAVSDPKDPRLKPFVFNARFYLDFYPDVLAVAKTKNSQYGYAEYHWLKHGIQDGRMGAITFSAVSYMQQNPDVAAAYGANNYEGAIVHYLDHGRYEGRRGSFIFDPAYYFNRYGDLQAAFGYSPGELLKHYIHFGLGEGRQASAEFAPAWYLGVNPDVRNAFGEANYPRGMVHYLQHGAAEGRPAAP
jgi:endonuclease/exonuclease/phosphatase family metal-dependent hydrolase